MPRKKKQIVSQFEKHLITALEDAVKISRGEAYPARITRTEHLPDGWTKRTVITFEKTSSEVLTSETEKDKIPDDLSAHNNARADLALETGRKKFFENANKLLTNEKN
jgi:hypothetical protein